ncbi:hypothetical protein MOBT1_002985 [Malassezia obtusa]|uniref:26S proteasome regulatory subunit Rpn7 N-terminal domain-containing protein n=1 Tax=Malassezia obtusa TaxID=76774 RepID=A0AAF0IT16_9BASI|nr:hypothetical protein MOBT1_002985 [Malassezia obtusa]
MTWEEAAGLEGTALRGWPLVNRLLYIAHTDTDLRHVAARRAAAVLREETGAVDAYRATMALTEDAIDEAWVDATFAQMKEEREKLLGELHMYQNNVIHESIRMAHQDLGNHYRYVGDMDEALLHYEKTREYCKTNEHALEMYVRAMQVAWDAQQYATVLAYADKAESVLATLADADVVLPAQTDAWRTTLAQGNASGSAAIRALFAAGGGGRGGAPDGAAGSAFQSARDTLGPHTSHAQLRARVRAYRTLAQWARCNKRVPLPEIVCDATHAAAYADVVSVTQIAWYAVLSVLSAPVNTQRKRALALVSNTEFRASAESDPAPRDALQAYLMSDFARCRALLAQHEPRLRLDPVIGEEAMTVLRAIEARLLAFYLCAFRRTSLSAVAAAFASDVPCIATRIVELIAAGDVRARLDWSRQAVEVETTGAAPFAVVGAAAAASAMRERLALVQKLAHADVVMRR